VIEAGCSQHRIAGVDEAGRGPLAGPVVAAAVILHPELPIVGLRDSKKLSARQRAMLALAIHHHALAWSIGAASVEEIDHLNILVASMLAMRRAVEGLDTSFEELQVDGLHNPGDFSPLASTIDRNCWDRVTVRCIVRGDQQVAAIAAASILAKTFRDGWMREAAQRYPGYGFERHMGYPTVEHRKCLEHLGPSPIHRRSFAWKSSAPVVMP